MKHGKFNIRSALFNTQQLKYAMASITRGYSYTTERVSGNRPNATRAISLFEFAVNNSNNKQNQNRNDRNRYNPICSHPVSKPSVSGSKHRLQPG
jgi:hypothetical protein